MIRTKSPAHRPKHILFAVPIVLGVVIGCGAALQLEGLSTKKPRFTKFTLKPTVTVDYFANTTIITIITLTPRVGVCVCVCQQATALPATSSVYRINGTNSDAATCILIRTDGLLSIQYRDKLNEDKEADVFLPDSPELWGDCTESDVSSITIRFKGFTLWMEFKKTPGGERWYLNGADLAYSSSNKIFEHIDRPGLDVSVCLCLNCCVRLRLSILCARNGWALCCACVL